MLVGISHYAIGNYMLAQVKTIWQEKSCLDQQLDDNFKTATDIYSKDRLLCASVQYYQHSLNGLYGMSARKDIKKKGKNAFKKSCFFFFSFFLTKCLKHSVVHAISKPS